MQRIEQSSRFNLITSLTAKYNSAKRVKSNESRNTVGARAEIVFPRSEPVSESGERKRRNIKVKWSAESYNLYTRIKQPPPWSGSKKICRELQMNPSTTARWNSTLVNYKHHTRETRVNSSLSRLNVSHLSGYMARVQLRQECDISYTYSTIFFSIPGYRFDRSLMRVVVNPRIDSY